MADKNQQTPDKQQVVELHDETLDEVSGGPVYVKIDSITKQAPGDGSVLPSISDGTSNTIR